MALVSVDTYKVIERKKVIDNRFVFELVAIAQKDPSLINPELIFKILGLDRRVVLQPGQEGKTFYQVAMTGGQKVIVDNTGKDSLVAAL